MASSGPREEYDYMATLAENAKRYEEMVEFMEKASVEGEELTVEERSLFSVTYNNVIRAQKGLVAHHLLHRAEGGEARQRGPRHDHLR
ncbi:14-3-3-like protein A [Nymphaea thermarum]|nr:14-3-3-like protein A [Nymphaea thermarum]